MPFFLPLSFCSCRDAFRPALRLFRSVTFYFRASRCFLCRSVSLPARFASRRKGPVFAGAGSPHGHAPFLLCTAGCCRMLGVEWGFACSFTCARWLCSSGISAARFVQRKHALSALCIDRYDEAYTASYPSATTRRMCRAFAHARQNNSHRRPINTWIVGDRPVLSRYKELHFGLRRPTQSKARCTRFRSSTYHASHVGHRHCASAGGSAYCHSAIIIIWRVWNDCGSRITAVKAHSFRPQPPAASAGGQKGVGWGLTTVAQRKACDCVRLLGQWIRCKSALFSGVAR